MTAGSLVTLLGFLTGIAVFWSAARRRRLATEGMIWIGLAALIGGVLGAKLTHWLLSAPEALRAQPLSLFDPRTGGRTILGGVAVGWVVVELAKRRLGIRRTSGDLFALALPAGVAVGRVGCFLNGCCHGVACNLPWAVWQHEAWRHPVQLYAAAGNLALFGLLLARSRRDRAEGLLFAEYLIGYGLLRFTLEFWRDHGVDSGPLSSAQWACLALLAAGVVVWRRRRVGQ